MTEAQELLLIERLASAHRSRLPAEVPQHPVFQDLSPEARERAYRYTSALRELEAAFDPEGLSSTARAVLARL
jgi:hypothetical protein